MSNNENFDELSKMESLTDADNVENVENVENNEEIFDEKQIETVSEDIKNEDIQDEIKVQDGIYVLSGQDLVHNAEMIKKDDELAASVHIETKDDKFIEVGSFKSENSEVKLNDEIKENKKNNNYIKYSFGLVGVAAVIIACIVSFTMNMSDKKNNTLIGESAYKTEKPKATIYQNDSKNNKDKDVAEVATTDGETVADIVDNVMPAIVSIACTVEQQFNFFGSTFSEDSEGSGSGIIIGQNDKQVLIATNNHVIEGASTVMITFNDGKEVKAEIKGTDSSNDLAVVSVNIDDLDKDTKAAIKIASIGKSADCKVGEVAIAIGNALGYGQSVTVGVISALNRSVATEDYNMELIQTDAAINPGNSGGALLNSKGEVIGINSVKYVSEDTEGMGYAIPITEAVEILNELMNYEEIPESQRAYLGIVGIDIDDSIAARSNLPKGVFVQEISKGSPAQECGMKTGDIIIEFAGKKVSTMENIQNIMKNKRSGEKAEVKVMQATDGRYKEKTYTVTFGARSKFFK